MSHYKDPYEAIRISWNVVRVLNVAQVLNLKNLPLITSFLYPKQPKKSHISCNGLVHHPIDSQPLRKNGWPSGSRIL